MKKLAHPDASALARSAIEFLEYATEKAQESPKVAIICLATAVELAVKARLCREHWTLTLAKIDEPKGKLVSATDGMKRLKQIGDPLSKNEEAALTRASDHRNQVVHSVHYAFASPDPSSGVAGNSVLIETLTAGYYLVERMRGSWAVVFESVSEEIQEVDVKLHRLTQFLTAKYNEIRGEIADRNPSQCVLCKFESVVRENVTKFAFKSRCHVCLFTIESGLSFACDACHRETQITADSRQCSCGKEWTANSVAEQFEDSHRAYLSAKLGDGWRVNCGHCEQSEVVVACKDTESGWVCIECLDYSELVAPCEWCGELSTHLPEYSGFSGCAMCDGAAGHHGL